MSAPTLVEVPRDRWGRPLIVPPGGGEPVPYTRASSLAKMLDDTTNLMAWKQRVTAVGLARRPDLRTRLAGVLAAHRDPLNDGKRDLNGICREAAEAGGGSTAASAGTGLHTLTEALDRGVLVEELDGVDAATAGRLREYEAATADLEVLDIETFVVNDELAAAGTFDRLVRLPDGRVVVADLKTGAHDANYPLAVATQIATYARGRRYDPTSGERAVLHPGLDTTTGLLIHLPQRGTGCRVYALDLVAGWEAAQVAARVAHIRAWKAPELCTEVTL